MKQAPSRMETRKGYHDSLIEIRKNQDRRRMLNDLQRIEGMLFHRLRPGLREHALFEQQRAATHWGQGGGSSQGEAVVEATGVGQPSGTASESCSPGSYRSRSSMASWPSCWAVSTRTADSPSSF